MKIAIKLVINLVALLLSCMLAYGFLFSGNDVLTFVTGCWVVCGFAVWLVLMALVIKNGELSVIRERAGSNASLIHSLLLGFIFVVSLWPLKLPSPRRRAT